MLKHLVDVARARATGDVGTLSPAMAAAAAAAPADVADLITILGTRQVRLALGSRSIESRYLRGLAETWQQVKDDTGESDAREAELASGVQIGASAGGEVVFGVCWGSRGLITAEIDLEDAMIKWFASWDAFLDHVKEAETKRGQTVPEGLAAILPPAVAAPAAPAAQPAAVRLFQGTPPSHPFAQAQAHFKLEKGLLEAGPTPRGRVVLVRRFAAGSPYTPSAIEVREKDGSVRSLPWTDTHDVYGLCLVPGQEKAYVCAGAPGALVEIDLDTGAQTQRLANVRWTCGFVDDAHFAVHEDGEARVYALGGAAPIASAKVEGMNLFVGHGRVFTLPPGPTGVLQIHRWSAGALVDELRSPLEPRVFFLSAAVEYQGRRLLGSVDWQGQATWFDLGPA
ncbi:MAG: hypothetical protein IT376_16650 [Polyangiaceae bacterium]|nr:hypothetical protein [Polyangiaceae bacterium]